MLTRFSLMRLQSYSLGSKFSFLIFVILILSGSSTVWGYTVRPDHPRLYMTRDNIDGIRNKIQSVFPKEMQQFVTEADQKYSTILDYTGIQNFAFLYYRWAMRFFQSLAPSIPLWSMARKQERISWWQSMPCWLLGIFLVPPGMYPTHSRWERALAMTGFLIY